MSDLNFYRSKKTRKRFRTFAKKATKHKRRTGLLVLACILLFYLLFDNKGIIARIQLEGERNELLAKIDAAQHETDTLHRHIEALTHDRQTIETIAREKYGMTRNGEKLYRIQKKKKIE
jgi:cell division protein FtsB